MKEGKVIFIDKTNSVSEEYLESLKFKFYKKKIVIEFASELPNQGFYSLQEAVLALVQKGVKKVSAYPLSLGENYDIPIYWGTY